jgi:hypothetical protein
MATLTHCTLRDLVQTISDDVTSDAEVVATVVFLINSGRVRLCGTFAGACIDLAPEASTAPFSSPCLLDSPQDGTRQTPHGAGLLRRPRSGRDPVGAQHRAQGGPQECAATSSLAKAPQEDPSGTALRRNSAASYGSKRDNQNGKKDRPYSPS